MKDAQGRRIIHNGELEHMRRVMDETKIKTPDHLCANEFMRWAFDKDLKWYDMDCYDDQKMRFKTAYRAWVEAWKQAKTVDWEDVKRANRPMKGEK